MQHYSQDFQKRPPDFTGSQQASGKVQYSTASYSQPDIFQSQHDIQRKLMFFFCRKTAYIDCCCLDVHCYNWEESTHFAQACPDKIPPLWTPHHHNRSCYWPHYKHNCRDRLEFLNYRHSHGRHFNWSWSHHWSHHDRSSSNYMHPLPIQAQQQLMLSFKRLML